MPKKIAVLGGGMAALTAAYELACESDAAPSPKYEITVYQMGWRLGGKGASGVNRQAHGRIEEHGLHIWFGAYDNAFRTMRAVYADCPDKWPCSKVRHLDRAEWPERSITVAFQPQDYYYLMEERHGGWSPWRIPLPSTASVPGRDRNAVGELAISVRDLIKAVQNWLPKHFAESVLSTLKPGIDLTFVFQPQLSNLALDAEFLRKLAAQSNLDSLGLEAARNLAAWYDEFARALWRWVQPVLQGVTILSDLLGAERSRTIEEIRRAWELFDTAQAIVKGALREGLVTKNDWDQINDLDMRKWLERHVIDPNTVKSAGVTGTYDLFFSYPRGNTDQGLIEAGTGVRATLWLLATYTGAVMWRMNAGMGDTIFAPLYNALKARGVKFKFFHKAVSLGLSADAKSISTITLERQATVTAGDDLYNPFVTNRGGLDCWPHVPDFGQLDEGAELAANWDANNLESDWSRWQTKAQPLTLKARTGADPGDFDEVIVGIPISALRPMCGELIRDPKSTALRTMFNTVQTVETQAFQVWLDTDLTGLGTPLHGALPILSTFVNPLDTYADMTHLVDQEDWPPNQPPPRHVAYFCGVLADEDRILPTKDDPNYPATATVAVKDTARRMFTPNAPGPAAMSYVWPAACTGAGGTFNWNLLRGANVGPARFDEQFFRANIDLTERYVLATPGTSQARLAADGAGYENLFLTGDWIANGLSVGCIEGAVLAGIQAARAVSRK